ncbi:hypothetical protein [Haloechinothrix salitolerans]|uniref:Uncharacterized protein n=1 Tax=Haloechinothrix salitolerans TaxID=926830 RepID=A0ABW2C2K3_9PSEU
MTERTERASANEAVANLGTEIMLLVEMIVEHAAPWLDGLVAAGHTGGLFGGDSAASDDEAATEHGTSQYDCGWCPLCAVVSMARGNQPEFSARAIEQLAQLVGVLRAVLADRWYPGEGIHMPGVPRTERQDGGPTWTATRPGAAARATAPTRPATGRASGSRAQRITVRKAASTQPSEPADQRETF